MSDAPTEASPGRQPIAQAETMALLDYEASGPWAETIDAAPLIGTRVGHFRLIEQLGQGGMGVVYRAMDESLDRDVAVKLLRPTAPGTRKPSDSDAEALARLTREARSQARVNHPNVVQIYFVGTEGPRPYFAMELVDGPSLADKMADGPLPFAEVVDVARQTVAALKASACLDVVHGDIKPANILMARGNTVKLGDFGLSRRLSEMPQDRRGPTAGTPRYLAPEVGCGEMGDIRSDMYSLGVMLFEMTFGRGPYAETEGSSVDEVLRAHSSAKVEFPEVWPCHLPRSWRAILSRLLAKDPADRYASYRELALALQGAEPSCRPRAARAPRLLAWGFDLLLVSGLLAVCVGWKHWEEGRALLAGKPGMHLMLAIVGVTILVCWSCLMARWGTSPGKRLFQIRTVDHHGLAPAREVLFLRGLLTLAPLWLGPISGVLLFLGAIKLTWLVGLGLLGWLIVDIAASFFGCSGRTLHDRLLGTHVVLDPESGSRFGTPI